MTTVLRNQMNNLLTNYKLEECQRLPLKKNREEQYNKTIWLLRD